MDHSILLLINLRGGADGLNMLIPYREDHYFRSRPTLAIPKPGEAGKSALELNQQWAIHPALEPLMELYLRQDLAFVQAVGWPGTSHSHFEAWDDIEAGGMGEQRPGNGWLARFLQAMPETGGSALRGVALSDKVPRVLSGASGVSALQSFNEFQLATARKEEMSSALRMLYQASPLSVGKFGVQTLNAIQRFDAIGNTGTLDPASVGYPTTRFGAHLFAVDQLIRAGVGLKVACVDLDGWDTHFAQGATDGLMANLMAQLATGIRVFFDRLGAMKSRLTMVVMTEFGRRVEENASGGTDHGAGGVMLIGGGRVKGGKVYGTWPGVAPDQLSGPGDVKLTTDFRQILGELVASIAGEGGLTRIFPGFRFSAPVLE